MTKILTLLIVALAACGNLTPTGDITAVNTGAGTGLTGGSNTGSVSLSLLTTCASNEILKWSGSAWACAPDGGGFVKVAPSSISGTVNNWNPGVTRDSFVYISASAGANITGITGGADGMQLRLYNSSSQLVTLFHNDAGSSAGNKLVLHASTVALTANLGCSVDLAYNSTTGFWYEVGYQCAAFSVSSVTTSGTGTFGGAVTDSGNRVFSVAGTGLTSSGATVNVGCGAGITCNANDVQLNLTSITCGAGQHINQASGSGIFTCTADAGDITDVVAGAGLTGGASSGSATLDIAATSGGMITVSANDIGITFCTADKSLVMNGTGTAWGCFTPQTGSGTPNRVAKWTGTNNLGNSNIVDDGTDVIFATATTGLYTRLAEHSLNFGYYDGGSATTYINYRGYNGGFGAFRNLIIANGAGNSIVTFTASTLAAAFEGNLDTATGKHVAADNGGVYLVGNGMGCAYATNANAQCTINAVGYQEGTTQYRDLSIQDGKGTQLMFFDGNTGSGTGGITTNVPTQLGDSTGDTITVGGGQFVDTGTAPSSFTCGTSPTASGGRWSFKVHTGTGLASTCVITFSTAFSATPTCVTSAESKVGAPAISAVSTSSVSVTEGTGGDISDADIYVICIGH